MTKDNPPGRVDPNKLAAEPHVQNRRLGGAERRKCSLGHSPNFQQQPDIKANSLVRVLARWCPDDTLVSGGKDLIIVRVFPGCHGCAGAGGCDLSLTAVVQVCPPLSPPVSVEYRPAYARCALLVHASCGNWPGGTYEGAPSGGNMQSPVYPSTVPTLLQVRTTKGILLLLNIWFATKSLNIEWCSSSDSVPFLSIMDEKASFGSRGRYPASNPPVS